MHPEYHGVKFYSANDMSIGWELKQAEPILTAFDKNKQYTNINEVLELFNIQQLIDIDVPLRSWSVEQHAQYKTTVKSFSSVIGRFFATIDDNNFLEMVANIAVIYVDDFWILFSSYKLYNTISSQCFYDYLCLPDTALFRLLGHKEIVKRYNHELAEVMRTSDQTIGILCTKFLEKSTANYYIPSELKPDEFEKIFWAYVNSGHAKPYKLQLIMDCQSTKACPISDRLRRDARQKYKQFWEDHKETTFSHEVGIGVRFEPQDEIEKYENKGSLYTLFYDTKWFEDNLDYPTILNNFWHVFGMFDYCARSRLVSIQSDMDVFERIAAVEGIKFYPKSFIFRSRSLLSSAQTAAYYDFLKGHNIELENVFKWFFEEYLPSEFDVNGFSMIASASEASLAERCRSLACEMDSVLKQFRMYVRDGEIDRELFEMSEEHLIVKDIPSLIPKKYGYVNSEEIQQEMFALFSDQSVLSYTEKTGSQYSTLSELLYSEQANKEYFDERAMGSINWLAGRGSVQISEDGFVKLSSPYAVILRDIYDHDVVCLYRSQGWNAILDKLILRKDLRIGNTLFSEPECDYLDFMLNKSKFSNGLNLRNKYAHGSYPLDADTQERDYIELLKVMILVITKINDEFCYREEQGEIT